MSKSTLYLADGRRLKSKKTLVMGVLNATPDSFSDGGDLSNKKNLEERIKQIIKDGADILDVGGESTRPGHSKVEAKEELSRVLPLIKAIRQISKSIPISIDTQKAEVAVQALANGVSIINDVSALNDPAMAEVVKKYKCSIILMRGEGTGKDVVSGTRAQFIQIIEKAKKQGLKKKYILLDAGLGFGDLKAGDYKSFPGSDPEANIKLILDIKEYSLGMPVVIGASRKRFIGDLTGVENAKDRLAGSLATAVMAQQAGAAIVRVHDVAETVRVLKPLSSR